MTTRRTQPTGTVSSVSEVALPAADHTDSESVVGLSRPAQIAVKVLRYIVAAVYLAAIGYLCAIALDPNLLDEAPAWLHRFGAPGSWITLAVVLLIPLTLIPLSRVSVRRRFSANPVLIVAVMAASAAVLGFASFYRCNGTQSPVFAPLAWTLGLFVGSVEERYGKGGTGDCAALAVPAALELARLLAIATTLTTAVAAARTLFRAQFDRLAIWRARSLTVVVGVDEDTMSMVHAIAQRLGRRETLVIVTSAVNRTCIDEARSMGARVREVASLDHDALAELAMWRHLDRLYLLSDDPVRNETRLRAIDFAMDRLNVNKPRLPLTVRIDDPWQAETWRRSFLDTRGVGHPNTARSSRWVADAVGRYENTAAILVRHLVAAQPAEPPCDIVLICGLYPLTYALMSEFAQVRREQSVYQNPGRALPTQVVVMASGADGFLHDHRIRQDRIAPGETALDVSAVDIEPTVDAITAFVSSQPGRCNVILTDPSMETNGTRLSNRLPRLRIYAASTSTGALPKTSIVSNIFPFPITLDFEPDAPQDAWERAAELIHEAYRANAIRGGWPIAENVDKPWPKLDRFWQQSNRRQVTHTLALVESVGQTWNTLDHPPTVPLPTDFDKLDRIVKLEKLGFSRRRDIDVMIREEHENWRAFYEREGWRHAPERNDEKRRHNRLLSWDALLAQDKKLLHEIALCQEKGVEPPKASLHENRSLDSLVDVLHTLRSLGYRSIPKHQWRRYQFADGAAAPPGLTGIVLAREILAEETIVTADGDVLAQVGDWVIQGPHQELAPIPAAEFLRTYQGPLPTC